MGEWGGEGVPRWRSICGATSQVGSSPTSPSPLRSTLLTLAVCSLITQNIGAALLVMLTCVKNDYPSYFSRDTLCGARLPAVALGVVTASGGVHGVLIARS